jgi:hypothetical protein
LARTIARPDVSLRVHSRSSATGAVSIKDAEDVHEVIERMTRTNAHVARELNALIGAITLSGGK